MSMRRVAAMIVACCVWMSISTGCQTVEDPVSTPVAKTYELGFQFDLPAEGEEFAILHTNYGDVYVRVFPEQAPKAVENFKTLSRAGYYDGVLFHRIVKGKIVQTGDPTGIGNGGESCFGTYFEDEFNPSLGNFRGALAMANAGEDMNGSQFFINQADVNTLPVSAERAYYEANAEALTEFTSFEEYYASKVELVTGEAIDPAKLTQEVLDAYDQYGGNIDLDGNLRNSGGYTVFGQVFYGMDNIDAIAKAEVDSENRPTEMICIESVEWAAYRSAFYPTMKSVVQERNVIEDSEETFGFQTELPAEGEEIAVIHTNCGDLSVRLFPEYAPKAVENFKALANDGFYDDATFYSVSGEYAAINETSLPGADDGTTIASSFGEVFEDEFNADLGNLRGALSMTNGGTNCNGVRFFINNGISLSDSIAQARSFYETNEESYSKHYATFGSYFADRMNLRPDTVTDELLALYEQYGGNIECDGPLKVSGGNVVFGQVFEGWDTLNAITTAETENGFVPSEDIIIDSITFTTYRATQAQSEG